MRTSEASRFSNSFGTCSQNPAPSVRRVQRPRTSRVPSGRLPSAMRKALAIGLEPVAPRWLAPNDLSSRIVTRMASKNTKG